MKIEHKTKEYPAKNYKDKTVVVRYTWSWKDKSFKWSQRYSSQKAAEQAIADRKAKSNLFGIKEEGEIITKI